MVKNTSSVAKYASNDINKRKERNAIPKGNERGKKVSQCFFLARQVEIVLRMKI